MLLHDSRRAARVRDGEIVLLADQDRGAVGPRADRRRARRRSSARWRCAADAGPYVLQAAIASLHAARAQRLAADRRAATASSRALTGSPVVELNRAVALAEAEGPEAGLRVVERSSSTTTTTCTPTRAELLRRLERTEDARVAYRRALELVRSEPERRFLERRLSETSRELGSSA